MAVDALRWAGLGATAMAWLPGRRRRSLAGAPLVAVLAVLAGCAAPPQRGDPPPDAPAPRELPAVTQPRPVTELPALTDAPATTDAPAATELPAVEFGRGRASWYGPRFHGRRTASGERFDMNELTAAHRTLPFGTRVRVRNIQNGREVVVRINDRGPHIRKRIIDLSKAAAAALDLLQAGEAPVVLIEP